MHGVFQRNIRGKILSEYTQRQLPIRQFALPIFVGSDWITVDRLMLASMDSQISLSIAVQVQLAEPDAPAHRLLVDPGGYHSAAPDHFSRQARVKRCQLHLSRP